MEIKESLTRDEIIEKGEQQLDYILKQLIGGNSNTMRKTWANIGLGQLDMLYFILDDEYEKYDYYFWKFEPYI